MMIINLVIYCGRLGNVNNLLMNYNYINNKKNKN